LLDGDAFLHELKQAVRSDLEAAANGDTTGLRQQLAQLGREGFLEADVAPPRDGQAVGEQALGERAHAGDLVTTAPADVQEIALGLTVRHWFALGPTTAIAPELGLGGIVSLIDAQVLGVERTTSTVSPLLSPGLSLGQELGSPHAVLVLGLRTDLLTRRARVLAGEFGLYDSGHVRLAAELGLGGRF
jgi:hypothetical protein